jgi:uncharacterized protein YkwD
MIDNQKEHTNWEELRQSIVDEHNKLRSDPQSYIPVLEAQLEYFKDNILYRPGETPVQTYEGKEAFLQAIEYLRTVQPVEGLTLHEAITAAANEHAVDIGTKGLVTHEGSDGRNLSDRIENHAEWEVACGENLDFGSKNAVNIIVNLLVDDGVEARPKRNHLFNPKFRFVGVGVHEHREYDVVVVLDYAGGIREKGTPFYDYKNYKFDYEKFAKETAKEKRPKTSFQLDDPDAPYETKSVKIVKENRLYDNRLHKITKKYYTLQDGTIHIVEVEDV